MSEHDAVMKRLSELEALMTKFQNSITSIQLNVSAQIENLNREIRISAMAENCQLTTPKNLDDKKIYKMEYVDAVTLFEIKNSKVLDTVMGSNDTSLTKDERGGPSDPFAINSGHFYTMIKRYVFAGKMFCMGKNVLDTCCGLGWGSTIIENYTNTITSFDSEKSLIENTHIKWPRSNINWCSEDALSQKSIEDKKYDVALSMEAIEHFHKSDGEIYLKTTIEKLRPSATFVGTSFFPDTRHQADNHASLKRPDHHYLWTKNELKTFLLKYFDAVYFIEGWMFVALRKK